MHKYLAGMLLLLVPLSLKAGKVEDLEAEVRSLRTQLELTQRREEDYRKQVEELGKKFQELSMEVKKSQADYQVELDQLQRKINEVGTSILATKMAIDELNSKLDKLPAAAPPEQTGVQPMETQPMTQGQVQARQALPGRLDYKQLYQAAVEQFQRKNYEVARSQFEAFLKAYPKTELSDNAQFWLAECYYAQANYQRAILEYDAVRKNYPNGNKVPASYWKMSLAFERMGNREVAQSFLKELVEKYPESPEAGLARDKLNAAK